MARTLTDKEYAEAKSLIDKHLVPKIEAMVESVNKALKKKNIRVGVELQWYMDSIEEVSNEENR